MEDAEGFLWWATMDGLMKYDGNIFKKYRYSADDPYGLGSNQTTAICQADDGKIWVGTGSEGIYIFDPETEHFKNIRSDPNQNSISDNGISEIAKDKDGNIWIGTRGSGVNKYDPSTDYYSHYDELSDGIVFLQHTNGDIWIGYSYGLAKYNTQLDKFELLPVNETHKSDWQYNRVFDLAEDGKERIWIGSIDFSPYIYDVPSQSLTQLKMPLPLEPRAIEADHNGDIWMSGGHEGILKYDVSQDRWYQLLHDVEDQNSCPQGIKSDLYFDQQGNLWLLISDIGISKMHKYVPAFDQFTSESIQLFHNYNDTTIIFQGSGDTLRAINTLTGKVSDFAQIPSKVSDDAFVLFISSDQEIYFAEYGALENYQWNPKSGVCQVIPSSFSIMAEDKNGNIWMNDMFKRLDPRTNKIENLDDKFLESGISMPENMNFLDILIDHDGFIWLSTDHSGLWMYDPQADTIANYRHDPEVTYSIASDVLYDLYLTSDNQIAIGTIHGLSILDQSRQRFKNYSESQGLAHNEIKAISEDDTGTIWVSTGFGISSIEQENGSIRNFDAADGLPQHIFATYSSTKDAEGNIYFGTYFDATRFHPDQLPKEQFQGDVYLLDFYLKKELIKPLDSTGILTKNIRFLNKIELNHSQGDIGFSFTMPVFEDHDKITYSYRLEGYNDDSWTNTSEHFAHFTNIQPGNYVFQVKVIENEEFAASGIASIEIDIPPPMWMTWWAYLLYLFTGLTITYSIYRFNLSRQLAKSEAIQLKEMDELKTRFFTNITHEFRTPLTVIMGINENIKGHNKEKTLIRRNSKNLMNLVNQLLDISKAEFGKLRVNDSWGNLIPFLQYLTESFASRATDKNINLTFYTEIDEVMTLFDEGKVQQILYNLLSNALKFTEPGGKVIVHVLVENHKKPSIIIKVNDSGIGIPEQLKGNIFDRFYQADNSNTRRGEGTGIGLALVKELVTLLEGDINVESTEGKGTQFTVRLPIRMNKTQTTPEFSLNQSKKAAILTHLTHDSIQEEETNMRKEQEPDEELVSKPILLIIEDNHDVAIYIESILEDDYHIHKATNGDIGINKAFDLIPDIIISDVMMPIKDGYEVCETLKEDIRTSHIPIILLTAKATQEDKLEGLKYGADVYLTKPFHKDELEVRLQKLIEAKQKRQAYYTQIPLKKQQISVTASKNQEGSHPDDDFMYKLQNIVEERHGDNQFGVAELTQAMGMSKTQMYRKLKALTNKTPSIFIRSWRLQKAKSLLTSSQLNISEIAYSIGFSDPNYFSRTFQDEFGQSPRDYRN